MGIVCSDNFRLEYNIIDKILFILLIFEDCIIIKYLLKLKNVVYLDFCWVFKMSWWSVCMMY